MHTPLTTCLLQKKKLNMYAVTTGVLINSSNQLILYIYVFSKMISFTVSGLLCIIFFCSIYFD